MSKAKKYKGKSLKLGGGGQFAKLEDKLRAQGKSNPGGLAAYIGRKKLGKDKFQKLAATGRKRANKKSSRIGQVAMRAKAMRHLGQCNIIIILLITTNRLMMLNP